MILVLRVCLTALLFGAWQIASPLFELDFFISRPSDILSSLFNWGRDGSLFFHLGITSLEAGLGFLFGGAAGMIVGVLLGRRPILAAVLDPFLTAFYSVPKAALAPLFILWFGIGLDMKVILAATVVFFLVFLNTFTGVREVSREQVSVLRLMGANERHLLTKVVIPSAIIWVFAGLRLSVPYALIGAIVGEIIAANRGLGYLLSNSAAQFDTAGVFASLFVIMGLSLFLNQVVKSTERMLLPWRKVETLREIAV
jgi:NitT/TauT family transport system permease protein